MRQRPVQDVGISEGQSEGDGKRRDIRHHDRNATHARHGRGMLLANAVRMVQKPELSDAIPDDRRQDQRQKSRKGAQCEYEKHKFVLFLNRLLPRAAHAGHDCRAATVREPVRAS